MGHLCTKGVITIFRKDILKNEIKESHSFRN